MVQSLRQIVPISSLTKKIVGGDPEVLGDEKMN
jgi:hypothetical protein